MLVYIAFAVAVSFVGILVVAVELSFFEVFVAWFVGPLGLAPNSAFADHKISAVVASAAF